MRNNVQATYIRTYVLANVRTNSFSFHPHLCLLTDSADWYKAVSQDPSSTALGAADTIGSYIQYVSTVLTQSSAC
jgi:hypothetical protein